MLSVLSMVAIGECFPCSYLNPEGLFHHISSPFSFEEGNERVMWWTLLGQ